MLRWHSWYWPLFCLQSPLWFLQLAGSWLDSLAERTIMCTIMCRSGVHFEEIMESLRLTCSNVTIILFNWVVCNACDSFPIEGIYGRDIHTQETSSAAGVAQNWEGKLSRRASCQPLTLVLQFSIIYWLHRAHGATQWSLCWKRTFIKYWYFGANFPGEKGHIWLKRASENKVLPRQEPEICCNVEIFNIKFKNKK